MNGFGFKLAQALDGRLRVERDPAVPASDGQVIPARIRRRMLCDATARAATGFATISEGMALSRSWLPWRRRRGQAMIAQGFRDLAESSVSAYAWAQADRTAFSRVAHILDFAGAAASLRAYQPPGDAVFGAGISGTAADLVIGDGLSFPDGEPTFGAEEIAAARPNEVRKRWTAPEGGHGFGGDGDFPSAGHEVDEGVVQPVFGSPRPSVGGTVVHFDTYPVGERRPEFILSPDLAAVLAGGPDEQV